MASTNEVKNFPTGLQATGLQRRDWTRTTFRQVLHNVHRHPIKYYYPSKTLTRVQCRTLAHRVLQSMALSIAIFLCTYQINTLTNDYLQYRVTWVFQESSPSIIKPPVVSVCIDILQFINITKLIEKHPIILNITEKYKLDKYIFLNWTIEDIIRNIDTGRFVVFEYLTIDEISRCMFSMDDILENCQYLSSNMTMRNCDSTFFSSYLFNLQKCYVFNWSNSSLINGSVLDYPQYITSRISSKTFSDCRLLMFNMNLNRIRWIENIAFAAHLHGEYPIGKSSSSYVINTGSDKIKVYGLSYSRQIIHAKPWPYSTECTDYTLHGFQSRDDCLERCLTSRFLRAVNKYARYSIVREIDDNKLLHSYEEIQSYREFIQRINGKCSEKCKKLDCRKEIFTVDFLYTTKQLNRNFKRLIIHFYPMVERESIKTAYPKIESGIFVGSVGGVFGIWFGFSFYTCIQYVTKATVHGWNVLSEKMKTWKRR